MAANGAYKDNATPSDIVSGSFGVEGIVIAGGVGQGADQPCREVYIWPQTAKAVKIGESTSAASTGPVLPEAHPIRLPISNTNKLYFNGTNGDIVYLLWRS